MREDCCTLEGLPWNVKRRAQFEPDDVCLSLLSCSRLWIHIGVHQPTSMPIWANCVLHSKEQNQWAIIDHLCSPYLSLATTISALTQQSSQELSVRNVLQSLRLKYSWGQSDLRLQRGLTPPSGSGTFHTAEAHGWTEGTHADQSSVTRQ